MPKTKTDVDAHIGAQLREFRMSKKLSQSKLAEELGVTFQQVQKYENGSNRLTCGKLYIFAQMLGKSPADFFPPQGHTNG